MSSLQQRCDFMVNVAQHALIMGITLDEFQKLAIAAYGVLESTAPETPAVPESSDRHWLIRKRGYYYRPNRAGYTAHITEAGRYTEAEAKAEAAIEPAIMRAIPLSQAFNEQETSPVQAVCDRAAHLADVPAKRCISGYWFCENCQICNSETIHHTSCPLCGGLRPSPNR